MVGRQGGDGEFSGREVRSLPVLPAILPVPLPREHTQSLKPRPECGLRWFVCACARACVKPLPSPRVLEAQLLCHQAKNSRAGRGGRPRRHRPWLNLGALTRMMPSLESCLVWGAGSKIPEPGRGSTASKGKGFSSSPLPGLRPLPGFSVASSGSCCLCSPFFPAHYALSVLAWDPLSEPGFPALLALLGDS